MQHTSNRFPHKSLPSDAFDFQDMIPDLLNVPCSVFQHCNESWYDAVDNVFMFSQ